MNKPQAVGYQAPQQMNKPPRIVPAAILFFDCSRLLFLITLFAIYMKQDELIRGTVFPYMMCAAPNALFLLMSFFLLIRPEASKAFIPLYITGKGLSLLCMLVWLYIIFDRIAIIGAERIMWAVFLGIADLGTIMGTALQGAGNTTENSAETMTEAIPETILKEGGE